MKRRQDYSPKFREETVKLVTEHALSLGEAAKRLTTPKGTLGNWVVVSKGAPPKAPAGSCGLMELEQEKSRLHKEWAEMKLERDILKKRGRTLPGRRCPVRVHETVATPISGG